MKLSTKLLFLFIAATTLCIQSNAQQNTFPVLTTSVVTNCITHCMTEDTIPYVSDSSVIHADLTISLLATMNVSSIRVKFGTTQGASDLLDKVFTFDVFGNVGNGCTYNRIDDNITLGLGNFNGLSEYFSEVKIERNDHSLTDAIVFNR